MLGLRPNLYETNKRQLDCGSRMEKNASRLTSESDFNQLQKWRFDSWNGRHLTFSAPTRSQKRVQKKEVTTWRTWLCCLLVPQVQQKSKASKKASLDPGPPPPKQLQRAFSPANGGLEDDTLPFFVGVPAYQNGKKWKNLKMCFFFIFSIENHRIFQPTMLVNSGA